MGRAQIFCFGGANNANVIWRARRHHRCAWQTFLGGHENAHEDTNRLRVWYWIKHRMKVRNRCSQSEYKRRTSFGTTVKSQWIGCIESLSNTHQIDWRIQLIARGEPLF